VVTKPRGRPPGSARSGDYRLDLEEIVGIGHVLAVKLDGLGYKMEDIAGWNADDIDRVNETLHIKRHDAESWPEQAREILLKRSSPTHEDVGQDAERPDAWAVATEEIIAPVVAKVEELEDTFSNPFVDAEPLAVIEATRQELQEAMAEPVKPAGRVRRRLNPKKPAAEVIGSYMGARYYQGGIHFDNDGLEIFEDGYSGDFTIEAE